MIQMFKTQSDMVELFPSKALYLKPLFQISIYVQLPTLKCSGKSISNWEVMEKVKFLVTPQEFLSLKIFKTNVDFVRLEGELENKCQVKQTLSQLNTSTLKLSGYVETLKIRAAKTKSNFPSRHDWESFFRDAQNMNEMQPGERPDTLYIQSLPCKWFSSKSDIHKPSEAILKQVFSTYGLIRYVDIPALDPYRKDLDISPGTIKTFSFGKNLTFDAYIQYSDYMGFVKAMDALRNMKLVYKTNERTYSATIQVDFDKTKHLSEKSIWRRKEEKENMSYLEKLEEERIKLQRFEEKKILDRIKKEEERELAKRIEDQALYDKEKLKKKEKKELEKVKQRQLEIAKAIKKSKKKFYKRQSQAIDILKIVFTKIELEEIEFERQRLQQFEMEKLKQEKKKEAHLQKRRKKSMKKEKRLRKKMLGERKLHTKFKPLNLEPRKALPFRSLKSVLVIPKH